MELTKKELNKIIAEKAQIAHDALMEMYKYVYTAYKEADYIDDEKEADRLYEEAMRIKKMAENSLREAHINWAY